MTIVGLLLGAVGAIAFLVATKVKPDAETRVLAIGLVVAAWIYVGFALVAGASLEWVALEIFGVAIYSLFAGLGVRYSSGWLLVGWLAHPLWDLGLHSVGNTVGNTVGSSTTIAPAWYPPLCVSFDLVVAAYVCFVQVKLHLYRRATPS